MASKSKLLYFFTILGLLILKDINAISSRDNYFAAAVDSKDDYIYLTTKDGKITQIPRQEFFDTYEDSLNSFQIKDNQLIKEDHIIKIELLLSFCSNFPLNFCNGIFSTE